MLGGRMSNQDEDEVEDELAALERDVVGLPSVPTEQVKAQEELPDVPQKEPTPRVEERPPEALPA